MACVPAGAAVMCWVDSGDGVVQAGLTLVLSLAITGIAGAAMIWLHAWHPYALLAFPAACIISGVVQLRHASWRVRAEMASDGTELVVPAGTPMSRDSLMGIRRE